MLYVQTSTVQSNKTSDSERHPGLVIRAPRHPGLTFGDQQISQSQGCLQVRVCIF